jgi:hypothetical protein
MNKSRMLCAVILTINLVFWEQAAFAQESNASMEETLGWLTPKITNNVILPYVKGKTFDVNNVEWTLNNTDRCSLVWSAWKEGKEGKPNNLLVSVTLLLSDFDPERIEVTRPNIYYNSVAYMVVTLNTTDSKNSIKWKIKDAAFESSDVSFRFRAGSTAAPSPLIRYFNGSRLVYQAKQKEMAERVKDAFRRAIILCGGQQGKPKKPEPF